MKVKGFQRLADIEHYYLKLLDEMYEESYKVEKYGDGMLHNLVRLGVNRDEKYVDILEELNAVNYLFSRHFMHSHLGGVHKPTNYVILKVFNRYARYAETVHQTNLKSKFVKGNYRSNILKELQTLDYYRFKFTLPAWVDKQPDFIISEKVWREDLEDRTSSLRYNC